MDSPQVQTFTSVEEDARKYIEQRKKITNKKQQDEVIQQLKIHFLERGDWVNFWDWNVEQISSTLHVSIIITIGLLIEQLKKAKKP